MKPQISEIVRVCVICGWKRCEMRVLVSWLVCLILINGIALHPILQGIGFADSWTTKSDMPTARGELAVVVVGETIYAIGGSGAAGTENEEYDPAADSWATKAPMYYPRTQLAAATASNKIYALGGLSAGVLPWNEEYNPSTNSWADKSLMPTARHCLGAASVGGKIYAIGGGCGAGWDVNEEYNPATNSWVSKASMPTPRLSFGVAVVNDKIYTIGGLTYGHLTTANEVYDPSTNSWTQETPMMTERRALAVASVNGKIYAIGGRNQSGELSINEEYDIETDSWTTKTSMPTARWGAAAGAVNGKIYVIGGYSGGGTVVTNEEYAPDAGIEESSNLNLDRSGQISKLEVSPNPFSRRTTIDIRLKTKDLNMEKESLVYGLRSPVSLKIYDLTGRLVKSFPTYHLPLTTGVSWDGSDDFGRVLPDGAYFCKFMADNFTAVEKLILLQ
ncbi:MAG: hypothetical protein QMD71_09895 [bacterium]|nr:hypothetical protein [bacterium]